jgi:uncharacterized caspase-like protein
MAARLRGALGLAISLLAAMPAMAEERVALIIGNDRYQSLPKLDNAGNDARAMATTLQGLGFKTLLRIDAARREMDQAMAEFRGEIRGGAVGLYYFAGYGIQADGENYLVPVDARLESDLGADGVPLARVLQEMAAARNLLNIVILEACRDNPLPRKGRSASGGLAVIGKVPLGTVIAYAAAPNETAAEGDRNGLFTGALVQALKVPGLKIEDVFRRASVAVAMISGGGQQPWVQASLQGEFYFTEPLPPAGGAPQPAATLFDQEQIELAFWESIKGSTDAADFAAYLARYPNGTFVPLARSRLNALAKTPAPP